MIDRINSVTPRSYGDVSKLNNQRGGSGSAGAVADSAFQDTYGGVIYEPSNQMGQVQLESVVNPTVDEANVEIDELGVRLDLSQDYLTVNNVKREVVEESLTSVVRRIIHSAVTAVKDFFKSIWEGTDSITRVTGTEEAEPVNGDTLLSKASANRLSQLLAQNNRGKLAKNSDLLTYYDRSGRIVSMDPTDKNKILSGADHTIML